MFRVLDMEEDLIVSVFHKDDSGFFNLSRELLGQAQIPVSSIISEDKQTLPPTWFFLELSKSEKFVVKDCGEFYFSIVLSLFLSSLVPSLLIYFYMVN